MAVRLSLGATRARLISAFLIDAVVLSAVGGALGLVLSMWGMDLARAIGGFPDVIDPQLNAFVLGFTSAVSILTGVLGPSPCVPDTMWDGPPARSKRRSAALTPCSYPDNVRSVESQIAEFVAPLRLMTFMLTAFGVAGVLLAALGVFGTMSYAVTERRQELAIRAALGAGRTSLLGLVLGSALRITVVGILVGAVLALTSARALGSYLFGVTTADPLTYALVVALLGGVSVVACYRPACLAATADPATLLRP